MERAGEGGGRKKREVRGNEREWERKREKEGKKEIRTHLRRLLCM